MGTATFIAVIAAGLSSATWIDRHYAATAAEQPLAPDDIQTPSNSSAACVAADGSWKNWVWANVPMLSPKCAPDRRRQIRN
jgi:hypothetical protein